MAAHTELLDEILKVYNKTPHIAFRPELLAGTFSKSLLDKRHGFEDKVLSMYARGMTTAEIRVIERLLSLGSV